MDIAALSVVMKQAQVQQAVGVSVLKMAMDTAKQQGQDMAMILQSWLSLTWEEILICKDKTQESSFRRAVFCRWLSV